MGADQLWPCRRGWGSGEAKAPEFPFLGPTLWHFMSGCPRAPRVSRACRKAVQLFQGKLLPAEDDHESACTPLSCGWEMVESLCVPPVFTPAGII